MKEERPIIFNTEMVQAILEGRKTVTRRVMRPQPSEGWEAADYGTVHKLVNGVPDEMKPIGWGPTSDDGLEAYKSPYGKPGDILYVRETFAVKSPVFSDQDWATYLYKADLDGIPKWEDITWKPSIHMPKEASRIWLKVKDVSVERVQDITEGDAKAEGCDSYRCNPAGDADVKKPGGVGYKPSVSYRDDFSYLWDSINAKRENGKFAWDANPWVWCVSFEVISTTGKPEADHA